MSTERGRLSIIRTLWCGRCSTSDCGATLTPSQLRSTTTFCCAMIYKGWRRTRLSGWICPPCAADAGRVKA